MIKILLTDKDMEYSRALATAVSRLHNEFEITLVNFEDQESLCKDILSEVQDIFLIGGFSDEDIISLPFKEHQKRSIIILSESMTETIQKQTQNQTMPFWYLCKYVSVNSLITDLNFLFGFVSGQKNFLRKSFHTQLIGIYSVCEDAGKSIVSIGLARELSRFHDKSVLYLNLEELPATELFMKNNINKRNIGDFLYYLLERQNESLCSHLDGFVFKDEYGVEAFSASNGRNDLKCLSHEELNYVIKILSDCCRYDYIILDLGSDLTSETMMLLGLCCKIIMVQQENPVSEYKGKKMCAYLDGPSSVSVQERLIRVINGRPDVRDQGIRNHHNEDQSNPVKTIYIDKDENSFLFTGDHLEISLNHSFGLGIKALSEEILSTESGKNQDEDFTSSDSALEDYEGEVGMPHEK
jgi:MinD-like ATPase involved in chromosome partitioning or flagellar assembly